MDEYPGLWRRFAACADAAGALAFVQEFGSLWSLERYDYLDEILRTAELIRLIASRIDSADYPGAAELWNEHARPHLSAELIPTKRYGRFDLRPIPLTLVGALLLQTGEAIALNQQWRRCRNEGCPDWFRIGDGAHTSRREFCSDKCRVARARRHKVRQEA
jgi:hypothetical protein